MGFNHPNPTIQALYPTRTNKNNILRRISGQDTWIVDKETQKKETGVALMEVEIEDGEGGLLSLVG